MAQVNIHEAKTQLSSLVARVEQGEEIIIARDRIPVARLVPVAAETRPRTAGTRRGQMWMADDFDAPLAEDALLQDRS